MDRKNVEKWHNNYIVKKDSIISTIKREKFEKVIKGTLKHKIKDNHKSHEVIYLIFNNLSFLEKIRYNKK